MLVTDFLRHSALKHPGKPAVWHEDQCMTYGELDIRSNQLANYLIETGVGRGDRVAILCENSFAYVISYFAIVKSGAISVPLNTDVTSDLLAYYLNHSAARAVITTSRFVQIVVETAQRALKLDLVVVEHDDVSSLISQCGCNVSTLQDVFDTASKKTPDIRIIDLDFATIIYTSGTTGKPKGVLLSHLNLVCNTMSIVEYLHLTTDDRMMVTLPFFYIYGQSLLLTHVAVGGSIVIENKLLFPENIVRGIHKMQATGFAGVPSTFTKMLKRSSVKETTLETLRYVTQAGGHLAPEIRKHVSEAFAPASLYIMYGATEASPRMTYLEPSMLTEKLGSIGKAIPNVEVLVVDVSGQPVPPHVTGEIIARGSNIMVGYWDDADATKEVIKNGYYHTGDLGQIDDEGYIYVVGRLNDMIKSNGYRVSAIEVEDALLEMEEIDDVAVVAVADDITGEAIKAYLVLHQEQNLTLRTLREKLKGRLPEYKMPQYIEIMNSLPRNKSGKIMKGSEL